MPVEFRVGDVIRLRKPHPCGSYDWSVVRIGADIGLRCLKCSHRVMLSRRDAERRLTAFVARAEQPDPFSEADLLAGSGPGSDRLE